METTFAIREANAAIAGLTLGQACASGLVFLEVSCYRCPRKGRYCLTRLIDRHGAGKGLPVIKDELAADCPKRRSLGFHDQCGAYFPKLPASEA